MKVYTVDEASRFDEIVILNDNIHHFVTLWAKSKQGSNDFITESFHLLDADLGKAALRSHASKHFKVIPFDELNSLEKKIYLTPSVYITNGYFIQIRDPKMKGERALLRAGSRDYENFKSFGVCKFKIYAKKSFLSFVSATFEFIEKVDPVPMDFDYAEFISIKYDGIIKNEEQLLNLLEAQRQNWGNF